MESIGSRKSHSFEGDERVQLLVVERNRDIRGAKECWNTRQRSRGWDGSEIRLHFEGCWRGSRSGAEIYRLRLLLPICRRRQTKNGSALVRSWAIKGWTIWSSDPSTLGSRRPEIKTVWTSRKVSVVDSFLSALRGEGGREHKNSSPTLIRIG